MDFEVGYLKLVTFSCICHNQDQSQPRSITITLQHVSTVLGIPCDVIDIIIHNHCSTRNRTYKLKVVETNLGTLSVGDEFCKSFLIFVYVTILAHNSKQEGIWDLWDSIMLSDLTMKGH